MAAAMSALAVRLGIRPRPFRALARALLLMSLRSQHFARATGAKPGELLPPLFWVVGQYVLASGFLATALFMRVDVWTFAFCGLATSMLLAGTAVVVELQESVLAPDDLLVIGHRGVPARTYAAARLLNLGFYVTLLTAAANIFPAILGAALRDAGPWYLPAYLLACAAGSSAVTAAVILLAARRGKAPAAGVRDVLAWTQIVLLMLIFYGAQWMLRDEQHRLLRFFARPPAWLHWLPPAWLADVVAHAAAGRTAASLRGALALLVVGGLAVVLVTARLARVYAWGTELGGHPDARDERKDLGGRTFPSPRSFRLGTRPQDDMAAKLAARPQRALLAFCLTLLRRDSELRLRTLPPLATVVAVVAFGLATGQLASPFTGTAATAALSLAAVQLVVLAVPLMLSNLLSSRDHAASWLLAVAPSGASGLPARAARAAVCYGVALPALVVLSGVFAWAWQAPLQAALHGLFAWIEVLAVSWGTLAAVRFDLPFSRPVSLGGAGGGETAPWLAAVAAAALLLGAAEMRAAALPWRLPWGLAAYAAVLTLLWLGLRLRAGRFAP